MNRNQFVGKLSEERGRNRSDKYQGQLISAAVVCAILLFSIAAAGQTMFSGKGASAGATMSGAGIFGAPLTYGARTDTCETGTEAGCKANAACPTCTGTGAPMNFLGPSTMAALPAAGQGQAVNGQLLNGMNTVVTDPDFGAQIVRATDYTLASASTAPCAMGNSFTLGSGGEARRWASDSSKLLVGNTGNASSILAFNPATMQVTASSLCANNGLGTGSLAMSGKNPHVVYELNTDSESTVLGAVTSGAFTTPETVYQCSPAPCTTGPHATLQAINPGALMQIGSVSGGTPNNSTTWVGQTSHAVFAPTAAPTTYNPANTIYIGVICDGGSDPVEANCGTANSATPSNWFVQYSLLFNFNYVPGLGLPYFPNSATSCLPATYDPTWNGLFYESVDDSAFSVAFSDNGQSNGWASPQLGPVFVANLKVGSGCRVWNSHTDQITGDWGPTGQVIDGQHNYVTFSSISGAPAIGETLIQNNTGAQTQYMCSGVLNTLSSSTQQYTCGTMTWSPTPTSVEVGLIYDHSADASDNWVGQTSGAIIHPTAGPSSVPFYYPDALHDADQSYNPAYTSVSLNQVSNGKVIEVQGNTPSTGETTITFSGAVHYVTDQQVLFYSLGGSQDSYLNCGDANHCPFWTIVNGTLPSGGTTLVIADTVNPNGTYSNTESQSGCEQTCPAMSPYGIGQNSGYGFMSDPNEWQTATLIDNAGLSSSNQGHSAEGYTGSGRASYYTWHSFANPSLPCAVNGPDTPCPHADEYPLLQSILPGDQHGDYASNGGTDLTPMKMITTNVCGQASGQGNSACPSTYTSSWQSEVIGVENSAVNPNAMHCNYGSGAAPCTYRFNHTFNSNDNWNFNDQNAIGIESPDGQWMAFPSSWMNTLGCQNGSTTCWGSYVASGPPTASMTSATISTDTNGVITVTMSNQFCAPGGSQYYWNGSAVQTIACGTLAEQVTLSGFAESWANQTITLTAVGGCDSTDANAGNCASFSGTAPTGSGVPASYGPATEASGTQKATPVNCISGSGVNTYCQRADIWIAKLTSAHQ